MKAHFGPLLLSEENLPDGIRVSIKYVFLSTRPAYGGMTRKSSLNISTDNGGNAPLSESLSSLVLHLKAAGPSMTFTKVL